MMNENLPLFMRHASNPERPRRRKPKPKERRRQKRKGAQRLKQSDHPRGRGNHQVMMIRMEMAVMKTTTMMAMMVQEMVVVMRQLVLPNIKWP